MLRKLYYWTTRIGTFYIAQSNDGRFHPVYDDESLGSYATAQQAAEDLAGGHTFSISSGVDTADLGIPDRSRIDKVIREQTSDELSIHHIDLSLNALNNIGFLIRHNYAPPEAVHGFMKNTLLHGWRAFEPYIRYRRTRDNTIGEPSRYGEHLEWAVDKSLGPVRET